MIEYYYAGFDGHYHHGSIDDYDKGRNIFLVKKNEKDLWKDVIEYVEDYYDGVAKVKIAGTKEIIHIDCNRKE